VDEKRTLSDEEIQTTHPGESRSRWSVTDADGGDDTDSDSDSDDADSDADGTDAG
jgi:hypothetical protein